MLEQFNPGEVVFEAISYCMAIAISIVLVMLFYGQFLVCIGLMHGMQTKSGKSKAKSRPDDS